MKFFVTTPIYYVNALPHIGHVYSTVAADIVARYHRLRQDNVLFSTGTDENSQKNVEAAQQAGQPVQEYVDAMSARWAAVFADLGISHDVFVRTTSPDHKTAVEAMVKKITDAGKIYLGDYEGYYCIGCEAFKAENELIDGLCPIHKTKPKKIKEKNYFFKLTDYKQPLLELYQQQPDFVQPPSARNKMLYYIENEMEDISISRQAQEWGIRLPQDNQHAVYVWFDALINYLTVTGYPDEAKSKQWWPADLHIIGKDIIKFHCAIWPAMLMAAGLELPKKVFAHGFFTVDGQKISKSLDNAIDPLKLIKEYPFDAIRYYLLRDIPFGNDGDFSHKRLKDRYNADLANGLGNLVSRTLNMIDPTSSIGLRGAQTILDKEPVPQEVSVVLSLVEKQIENLEFDKALTSIWNAIAWADELIDVSKPWDLAKQGKDDEVDEVLTKLYAVLVEINKHLAPFMPETHEKLTELLTARPIKKPAEPLFARKE